MLYLFRLHPYLQTLDQARKVCQGQALQLVTKIRRLRIKKFYNIGPWTQCYKTFYVRNVRMFVIGQNAHQGLILFRKILLFLKIVQLAFKNLKFFICAHFFLQHQQLLSYQEYCYFLLNKNGKTHLKPMLPPGNRKWQLICPNW